MLIKPKASKNALLMYHSFNPWDVRFLSCPPCLYPPPTPAPGCTVEIWDNGPIVRREEQDDPPRLWILTESTGSHHIPPGHHSMCHHPNPIGALLLLDAVPESRDMVGHMTNNDIQLPQYFVCPRVTDRAIVDPHLTRTSAACDVETFCLAST